MPALEILEPSAWAALEAAHAERVRGWVEPHLRRRSEGTLHPVEDFLFDYYPLRPSGLVRWHPGVGVGLVGPGSERWLAYKDYRRVVVDGLEVVTSDPAPMRAGRGDFLAWVRGLLRATLERPPHFGCHGLHEWAMVYRLGRDAVRHNQLPLRMTEPDIATFLESRTVSCSHFDAFRFFTPEARPLNRLQPTRETSAQFEQAGCLHANMDLYKWAFKLAPHTPSELVADCFALARDIRTLDMEASPYDVSSLGYEPVAIETESGRAEYERRQRAFTERARPLRRRLLDIVETILAEHSHPSAQ